MARARVIRRTVVGTLLAAVVTALLVPDAAHATVQDAAAAPGASTPPAPTDPAVAAAWSWIQGQRGSGTLVSGASTITADRQYPADWTGPVSGAFTPRGVSSPVVHSAAITVDSPTKVPGTYSGVVAGHIGLTPAPGRWIVQVYRDTSSGRVQEPLQTLVAGDGSFTIDLGRVSNPATGTWALGLLDATQSYAPTGTPWPSDTYANWQVRAYVVTDTAYLVASQPARADGTFTFPYSEPGTKVFQLVDTTTGAVLAEQAPDYGLVRSYAGGARVYTYDQAVTLLAALAVGSDATELTSGLIALQRTDGGFVESADVRNPAGGTPLVRTGIVAVATYALLRRLQTLGTSDPTRPAVVGAAQHGLQWLLARRNATGLLTAGSGDYRSDGTLDTGADPGWVSTEHNLDAWQAFHLASSMLDGSYAADASALDTEIVGQLWNPAAGRFREGLDAQGNPDNTDPLDVSSWGTLFLQDAGHSGLAAAALAHQQAFASSAAGHNGYRAYYPQAAFPAAPANVWVEGTAGVVLARARSGDNQGAAADLGALTTMQGADGSFPYAAVTDTPTSMSTLPSTGATAWFVLASAGPASIW